MSKRGVTIAPTTLISHRHGIKPCGKVAANTSREPTATRREMPRKDTPNKLKATALARPAETERMQGGMSESGSDGCGCGCTAGRNARAPPSGSVAAAGALHRWLAEAHG